MKSILQILALSAFMFSCSCQPSEPADADNVPGPAPEDRLLITEFSVTEYPGAQVAIDQEEYLIDIILPYGSYPGKAHIGFTTGEGVTARPASGDEVDLSGDVSIFLSLPDGNARKYVVRTTLADPPSDVAEVRGVYLPSPSHTSSFITYDNVVKSIDLMDELNFNTLFVCAWAATKTAWDSDVLLANSTYTSASDGNMYSSYSGGSGDALKDIIETAHSKGIKVILWFEYGFMHATGGVNLDDPLLAKHPDWIGINSSGEYSNYNGTDFYLNGYDPEVQEFMLSLMEEAVEKYPDIDGIQGDDRLPAMPRNSGYDETTVAMYKAENNGDEPSTDCNNPRWVNWRLDKLNAFAKAMSTRLKAKKPSLVVCFAPNKYPWCEDNLMQDWPQWIADGAVDLLTVQFYVTSSYESDIRTALRYVSQNTDRNILNPAMILKNGSVVMSREMLTSQLYFNDSVGTCGESQFWFDGLYTDYVQEVFREFYPSKAAFPL